MDETGYIPKSLEAQERFLWWDFDQAILFILVMGMGVVSGAMVPSATNSICAVTGSRRPRGLTSTRHHEHFHVRYHVKDEKMQLSLITNRE